MFEGDDECLDAVVIGGGFYGASVATYLATRRGFRRVRLIEAEDKLLARASYSNQARVHNGYHYPRSFTTAFRSRVNLPNFVRDYGSAVKSDFTKLYAIARSQSKVTGRQFERFCREIGASLEPAPQSLSRLFEPRLIEAVYVVQEYAFDSSRLAAIAARELSEAGVDVRFRERVLSIDVGPNRQLELLVQEDRGTRRVRSQFVFNCTYSGLNQIAGEFPGTTVKLKHELTEMALIDLPPSLKRLGVTVMDGPFFSMMPFPARDLHTLSHVRYTPHMHWSDTPDVNPYGRLRDYDRSTRVDRMIRDVTRYLPSIAQARHVDSLFEVKTVLVKNEGDDGRPILFERHASLPGCYSILGGKIDNIYDVLERLDNEILTLPQGDMTIG